MFAQGLLQPNTFHNSLGEHSSFFSRAVHVGSEHPLEGKGNGDEEEDGADGAGLVVDDEVRGVENQQQKVTGQHKQE